MPVFIGRGLSIRSVDLDTARHGDAGRARATIRVVGPEARLRLGYLYWTLERDEAAQDELTKAAERAADADVRYLAQFLLGWIAITRGDGAAAIPRLEAALAARPASQSAALALASLELQRGDADKAHEIALASLDQRRADVDPWRLFLYGHHPRLARAPRRAPPGDQAMTRRSTRLVAVAATGLALVVLRRWRRCRPGRRRSDRPRRWCP